MMNGMFNGMFGKIAPGMCRLSINGGIAIKTSNGYKTYEVASGQLTNCDNFVFNIGEEFFFVVPTNRVKPGDIILANGKPKCVIEAAKNRITAINYEDSTLEQILPERHVFMGNVYFYGKIVSMFGNNLKKGKGPGKIMKYMMFSEMMKGNSGNGNGGGMMNNLLPLMFLGKGNMDFLDDFGDFGDAFDMDDDEDDDDDKQ
jgi:hypothetical protein